MIQLTFTGILLFVLSGLTGYTGYKVHIYVSTPKNWNDAYTYCAEHYKDLSSITSEAEQRILVEAAGGTISKAWIGLYREGRNPKVWMWSDGQSFIFNNLYLYSDNTYFCAYAAQNQWYNGYCPDERPFFCYYDYNLSLITMNMTWEDSLTYCRNKFTDLASATEQSQLNLLQNTIQDSTTDSAWTGLRFLEGKWHWVSKSFRHIPYQGTLLSCPKEPYRCGAYTKTTAQWEMRDCDEMFNFICY